MKILYIITGLGVGGAEKIVCDLSNNFHSNGDDVKVVYLYGSAVLTPEPEVIVKKIDILNPIKAIYRLVKIIAEYKPDIVHGHMFHANIVTRILKILLPKLRVVNTAHSGNEGGKFRMLSYRLSNNLVDVFTNVSEGAVSEFVNKKAVKDNFMLAVPNGIDLPRYKFDSEKRAKIRSELGITLNTQLIISVGSLREAKNFDMAIKSANHLNKNSNFDFVWIIIGEGPMRSELENKVSINGLSNVFRFVGLKENVKDYYSAADLFVSTSKWEGFGLVIAEAIAANLSVISTNTSGASQVIFSHDSLIDVDDSVALSDKIISIVNMNKVERERIQAENLAFVSSNFSMDKYCRTWKNIYEGIVR
ncbi:glycosyltransferase [Vibrio sp. nBUS_14]|uniref:glycosyltransferase n=1 Tax=Vibrio sp. nBUS_14 TaxID=3395321 RepID=UPI003EBB553F